MARGMRTWGTSKIVIPGTGHWTRHKGVAACGVDEAGSGRRRATGRGRRVLGLLRGWRRKWRLGFRLTVVLSHHHVGDGAWILKHNDRCHYM